MDALFRASVVFVLVVAYGTLPWTDSGFADGENNGFIAAKVKGYDIGKLFSMPIDYRAPKWPMKTTTNAVEPPLRIGSFNIQTLTPKKFNKPHVMRIVEDVVLQYDLILIMEILTTDDAHMKNFLYIINRIAPEGVIYNMALSGKHPYTHEHCAFLYRVDKLKVLRSEMFEDYENTFFRKPFIVKFSSPTLRDMSTFIAVGLHVKPNQAIREMNGLAKVYDIVKKDYQIEDVLMMGDFNADCSYVKENEWENITLWTREEFTWPIKTHFDTTTNHRSCALDRFVFAGRGMNDGIIMSSAAVFNFQEAYGLTKSETKEVSDHWPIEIQIRGRMSSSAEKHLISSTCVAVIDSRPVKMPTAQSIAQRVKATGFFVVNGTNGMIILVNETSTESAVLQSLKKLQNSLPEIISSEQFQGAVYKVRYGSLEDKSSFVEVQKPTFWITTVLQNQTATVTICRKTTVN